MSDQSSQLENELISVTVTESPHCRVKLDIEVKPSFAAKLHTKAIKNVTKEVILPGFRKGKAPEAVIKKQYEKEIEREFRDLFTSTPVHDAVDLCKLYPNQESKLQLNSLTCSAEGGKLTIEYERIPSIPTIDPSNIQLPPKPDFPITEEHLENQEKLLQMRQSEWQDNAERTIEDGDKIIADIEMLDAAENAEPRTYQDQSFFVVKSEMEPWMYDKVLGRKEGDVIDGEICDHDHSHDKHGHAHDHFHPKYKITVKKVQTAELPVVDEAFVEKFGLKSPEDLRNAIKGQLESKVKQQISGMMREAVQKEILEKYPFELPSSYIKKEAETRLERKLKSLEETKLGEEESKDLKEKLEKNSEKEAEHALRLYFIVQKVVKDQNLTPDQQELFTRYFRFLQEHKVTQKLPQNVTEDILENIRREIVWDAALDWIIEKASN